MKHFTHVTVKIFITGVLLLLASAIAFGQTNTATTSGAWETGSNWSLGHVPLAIESVVVPSTYSMTINANDTCHSLTINSGGTVTINGAYDISIEGNFSNSGTFTASNSGSSITFNADSNSSVTGSGSYTIAGTIELDMDSTDKSVDVRSSNFCAALTGSFTLTQGTWIMDNSGTISNMYNAGNTGALTIPNTVVLQATVGKLYLCNAGNTGNVLLEGELYINGGNVLVQSAQGYNSGQDFQYKVVGGISPILKVTSGSLACFAGFSANTGSDYINFYMSGGVVFVAYSISNTNGGYSNAYSFQLQDVLGGQTVMSGGTIIIQDACNAYLPDIDMGGANVAATKYSVTGGTVQFGYANTQSNSTYYGVEAEPATNYPNFDYEIGVAKFTAPFNAGNLNVLSLHINSNCTFWAATGGPDPAYNNNITLLGYSSMAASTFDDEGTFQSGTGVYTFAGNVAQKITSTITTLTFPNLTINNTSTGVTVATPTFVSGALTLTDGVVNTSSGNLLTLESGATSTAGSDTSYVKGPMAKIGNTAFVYPLGGGTNRYMPLGISAPATSTDTITAQYIFSAPANESNLNSPLTNVSSLEYWTLNETVLTDAIYVTLNWQSGPASGINSYDNTLQVADYSGGFWNDLGQSAITGVFPGAGSVTSTSSISNLTNLPFTFGSTNIITNPLPITLTSFTATYLEENKTVLAAWTVASQINNKEFIVEKTWDGVNYTQVGTVPGAGTTPFTISYSAVDTNPIHGISYYRLKQVDIDGNVSAFPPREIFIGNSGQPNSLSIYPNPVSSTAVLLYMSSDNNPLAVEIINAAGTIVNSFAWDDIQKGENNFYINTSELSSGIYFLRATGTGNTSVVKFIKL